MGLTGGLYLELGTYWRYGVHYSTGLTLSQDITYLVCMFLAAVAWSWTGGFVLGFLSGRTIWFTGPSFCLVFLGSYPIRILLSNWFTMRSASFFQIFLNRLPLTVATLFLILTIWGLRRGNRKLAPGVRQSLLIALLTVILTLLTIRTRGWHSGVMERWSEGAMRGGPTTTDLPFLLASWPALYMLWIANIRHRRTRTSL